jgi:outer membrane protein
MKTLIFTFLISLISFSVFSQNTWSLQECINYALENNIQIKMQVLNAEYNENILTQSKAEILPNLNFGASQAYSFGWSNDPFTNEFSPNNTQTLNLSLTSSVTLFNGFQTINTIKQNQYNVETSLANIEKIKNDISLNIAASFLQILFNKELLEIAKNQAEISKQQLSNTTVLVKAGSLAEGSLLEVEAQLALEELEIVNTENLIKTSYLTLAQFLELDSISTFEIEIPEITEPDTNIILPTVDIIYNEAIGLPQIKAAEYELLSSQKGLDIAKGGLSPSLTLSASYGTGYSDVRKHYAQEYAGLQSFGIVGATGDSVYVPSFNTLETDYLFFDQLSDNQSEYVALNLQIPIFNKYYTKTKISNSKINIANSQLQLEFVKNELYKDVQQSHNEVYSALTKYKASKKAVDAMQKSFDYTEKKYNAGLITTLEFNTSKNNLIKSQSDLLQAKYEYIFKLNILNFYRGIPLII